MEGGHSYAHPLLVVTKNLRVIPHQGRATSVVRLLVVPWFRKRTDWSLVVMTPVRRLVKIGEKQRRPTDPEKCQV